MSAAFPAVDVIVLCHDYERFVAEAIGSVLAQTRPPARVIVVDDGSSDGSWEVIGSFGDRVHAVRRPNGGQAAAIATGFAHSAGDVVLFLDADDVLEPDAVERVTEAFATEPGLARAHYPMRVVDGHGAATGEIRPPAHLALPRGDLRATTLRAPFDAPWAATSGNAFSAAVLRRMLPIPGNDRVGADWYLVHVSSLHGPVAAIDRPLARYRVHGGNAHAAAGPEVDLDQLGRTTRFAAATRREIVRHARSLGLPVPRGGLVSMSDTCNRLVLLRLGAGLPGDTRMRLLRTAALAAWRRRDARIPLRAAFVAWAAAMTVAPRRWAARLAAVFLFPDRRGALNPLLARLTRRGPAPSVPAART